MALIPILVESFNDPLIQLIVILTTFGIGLSQGIILGRAILQRFPRLQNHVKTVSFTLFILFLINAVLSVPALTITKIDLTNKYIGNVVCWITIPLIFWNEYWISNCISYFNYGHDFCCFKMGLLN